MKKQIDTTAKMSEACEAELESLSEFIKSYSEKLTGDRVITPRPGGPPDFLPVYRIPRYVYILKCRTINAFIQKYSDVISEDHKFFSDNAFDKNVAENGCTKILLDNPEWIVKKAKEANITIPAIMYCHLGAMDKLVAGFVLYNLYNTFRDVIPHAAMRADYIGYHLFRSYRDVSNEVKFLNPINI